MIRLGKTRERLLEPTIIHRLPGRIRLGVEAIKWVPELEAKILKEVTAIPGVKETRLSLVTTNILVHYDPETIPEQDIIDGVAEVFDSLRAYVWRAQKERLPQSGVQERKLHEESLSRKALDVAITGATLGFVWLTRKRITEPLSLWRRFTSLPAMTALALSAPIFRNGLLSVMETRRPNADTLSSTAILASLASGRDTSALAIIWLADLAELLTGYTMHRTRKAISDLLKVDDEVAWRIDAEGVEVQVPVETLQPQDRIMVHTGERISVDGVVDGGEATVDQASITGEFLPMSKKEGDRVFAGTVVKSGTLTITAERVGDETAAARIIHLVEEATQRRAPIQMFADKFSAQFIPVNFALALLVWVVTRDHRRALNMLIIDYSCGVRLSTATALAASISSAARQGTLIKGGQYLELLSSADTMIIDKTGTLTAGRPLVTEVWATGESRDERGLMALAAAAEQGAQHPLGQAVMEYAGKNKIEVPSHTPSETVMGRGAFTRVDGAVIRVGSVEFMRENGVDISSLARRGAALVERGRHALYVARDRELVGLLSVTDRLRDDMKKALNRLRNRDVDEIVLLTGDEERAAEVIATRLAMDGYEANVLPSDKAELVLRHQIHGDRVVMVGDGINDGPALAHADVGIAMGTTRTDLAMEAADIVIAADDALMLPAAVELAQKTMGIIRQNFATAIGVNTVGLVLGSIGVLAPLWGAVLHNATTVAVVGNSARLLWHRMLER